ncbi:hypothetical protein AB7M17_003493 [Bradyrhizobium sp. USDA 377]
MQLPRGAVRPASPHPAIERANRTGRLRRDAIARTEPKRIVARSRGLSVSRRKEEWQLFVTLSFLRFQSAKYRNVRPVSVATQAIEDRHQERLSLPGRTISYGNVPVVSKPAAAAFRHRLGVSPVKRLKVVVKWAWL